MLTDILTVALKEWQEMLPWSAGRRGTLYRLLLIVGLFGVFFPWQSGPSWVTAPQILIFSPYVAFFLVTTVVADSFAGERERHTLETLLSTRLPDRAIFLGKVTGALGFGWAVAILMSVLAGLATANLTAGRGEFLSYSAINWLGSLALSLLGAGLAAGIGVLLSLRAATVKQVQQNMALAMLLIIFVPFLGLKLLPSGITSAIISSAVRADSLEIRWSPPQYLSSWTLPCWPQA
ncbi:MAG TPA: ABC transporter permease [Spirochaetia bacterium]|nr:ABC transporter permease [Spirochaetia bacterium]